jgi:hypothetical protein
MSSALQDLRVIFMTTNVTSYGSEKSRERLRGRSVCILNSFLAIIVFAIFPTESQAGGGGHGHGGGGGGSRMPDPKNPVEVINPFAPDAEPVVGIRRRIEAIERYMYRRLENGTLEKRVHRLETRLIPWEHPLSADSLEKRVDHLWSVLAAANAKRLREEGSGYKPSDSD